MPAGFVGKGEGVVKVKGTCCSKGKGVAPTIPTTLP